VSNIVALSDVRERAQFEALRKFYAATGEFCAAWVKFTTDYVVTQSNEEEENLALFQNWVAAHKEFVAAYAAYANQFSDDGERTI
jgi:hypothetical protein